MRHAVMSEYGLCMVVLVWKSPVNCRMYLLRNIQCGLSSAPFLASVVIVIKEIYKKRLVPVNINTLRFCEVCISSC